MTGIESENESNFGGRHYEEADKNKKVGRGKKIFLWDD